MNLGNDAVLIFVAVIAVVVAFTLSGCSLAERLANGAVVEPSGEVIEPSGQVIEPSGQVIVPSGEVIEPHAHEAEIIALESDMCLVRAKHFRGLVRVPCDQIAREAAP